MSGVDLRQGVLVTEGKESASLSHEELASCRHSQDIVRALEAKLGHSLKRYYYFKPNELDGGWECVSGPAEASIQRKEVIVKVEKIVEIPTEPTMKALWGKWVSMAKGWL